MYSLTKLVVERPKQPRSRLDILVTNNTQTKEDAELMKYSRNISGARL